MYWGSVRFFRHLILALITVIFLSLGAMCIFLFQSNSEKSKKLDELNAQLSSMQPEQSEQPSDDESKEATPPKTADELCSIIELSSVSMDDFLSELYSRYARELRDIVAGNGSKLPVYSSLYEDMYVIPTDAYNYEENTVYLTFDDGPSANTAIILDILAKYDIKATFFVTGHNDNEKTRAMMKRVVDEGHSIGAHTYSHNYLDIYDDVESYLDDMHKIWQLIYEVTGVKTQIFRFAGGSVNAYNYDKYIPIIAEMQRRGFRYFDWNVASNDADSKADWISMYNDVVKGIDRVDRAIVLFHDGVSNSKTVNVVEDVIIELIARGKRFDRIKEDTMPLAFSYID